MSRKDDRAYATDDEETKRPPVMNSTEGMTSTKKPKPNKVAVSTSNSWKNNANQNKCKCKKTPVVTTKKIPPKPLPKEESDDEVEIVAPPAGYKPVLSDCKDPKKASQVQQALLESDTDSDDSLFATKESAAVFNAPPTGRHRRTSAKAEEIRKNTQIAIPGTSWRKMMDAHTNTTMGLSDVRSKVTSVGKLTTKVVSEMKNLQDILRTLPKEASKSVIDGLSRAWRDLGEGLRTVTMSLDVKMDGVESRLMSKLEEATSSVVAAESRIMTKLKDSTTDLKRHTTQKCAVSSDSSSKSSSSGGWRDNHSLPTNAGSNTSTEVILERLEAQDGILNHMDGQIDWLLEMVQGLQAKCPDHSGLPKKANPLSTVATESSDGTGTYTRNQRRNSTGSNQGRAASTGGSNTRYVSMTVNQYSKSVPNASNTTPMNHGRPVNGPATAPPRPTVQFKNVAEAVPMPFSQVQQFRQGRRVAEKTSTIPPPGPFQDPEKSEVQNWSSQKENSPPTYRADV
ncbi:unknown protein [Seminavis robusta]|uniref:Uncharacterized protein n=1 Tax=Seminavis robusta TaxID=568900 RepID=A0A9N8EML0_9STRA|nr:unknown protein [Seminavis robusta]|eukprot:Sro1234_g254910.1 n/a (511) ;mRNA; r:16078-17926